MAVLSTADRQRIWRGIMRFWSARRDTLGALTKADLQTAVNETDAWIDANAASYNAALSQPARGQLTAAQKNLLFCAVALARFGEVELLRRLLGEVD
jgi:hypothetical protein